jgi:hypothetical protein
MHNRARSRAAGLKQNNWAVIGERGRDAGRLPCAGLRGEHERARPSNVIDDRGKKRIDR